jgi:hypothetical protein
MHGPKVEQTIGRGKGGDSPQRIFPIRSNGKALFDPEVDQCFLQILKMGLVSHIEVTVHGKRILGKIPAIPRAEAGSEPLASAIQASFENPKVRAVLLRGHGTVAVGSDLKDLENMAELTEESDKIALLSALLRLGLS